MQVVFALVLLLCMILIYMAIEAKRNRIRHVEFHFSNFPKEFSGLKLFFISDIHHRTIDKKIIDAVRGKVDHIIIGGDLAEKGVPKWKVEHNLSLLTKVAPTSFVWGNNDYEIEDFNLSEVLIKHEVNILANKAISFKSNHATLSIVGVDDFGHSFDDLDKALTQCQSSFRILVSHYPDILMKLRSDHYINLLLSGHTHGGQIRLFGFGLTKKIGLKKINENQYILNSNGYGTTRFPLRLGAPAETHLITLVRKKNC